MQEARCGELMMEFELTAHLEFPCAQHTFVVKVAKSWSLGNVDHAIEAGRMV